MDFKEKLEFPSSYIDIEEMCNNLKREKAFCKANRMRRMKG